MRKILPLLLLLLGFITAFSQKDKKPTEAELKAEMAQIAYMDSVEKAMKYEHGTVLLQGGIAKINIPSGYKFLNSEQASFIVTNVWGNPPQTVLGMLMPENVKITDSNSYAFIIEWDEMGYVKDNDADEIDYDDLLKDLQDETEEANEERTKEGYEAVKLVGWAAKPFYDKQHKILHWAKEVKFGEMGGGENTLNYNVRILGRKGVLILNAVSGMSQLPLVNNDIKSVLNIVEFTEGNKYENFDSNMDTVAAVGIGGLVAGKVLAKLGFLGLLAKFFAPLLKFGKLGFVAIAAGFSALWRFITGRKKEEETSAEIAEDSSEEGSDNV
jgi:uncharacterized membrane-anchored protein